MRIDQKSIYGVVIITVLFAGCLSFWIWRSPNLEFRERGSPRGFRELVLEAESSGFDPILGLPPNVSGVSKDDRAKLAVGSVCDALFRDPNSPAVGSPHNKVHVVQFFDYRCPYCRTLTKFFAEMQDRVRIVYKEWPILGTSSKLAARAALAAAKQDRYRPFHMRLMNSRFIPNTAYIDALAVELGINQVQLLEDMNASDTDNALQRNAALASELGFSGTPGLVVGRTIVQGAIRRRQLESLIENEVLLPSPTDC
jgi:predicted DsbA family dithiol-disulfide isomerase